MIYEDLVAQHPEEPEYALYLGKALGKEACELEFYTRTEESLAAFNEATNVLTEAIQQHGSATLFRRHLAWTYKQMALRDG